MASEFRYDLGQAVIIDVSGEVGFIRGRAEYDNSENMYYLEYKSADGRAEKQWWDEISLTAN